MFAKWFQLTRIYTTFFGYGIYHKPHIIFKSKSYESHNRNTGIFSGNDTIMIIHRDLRMWNFLQFAILSEEFIIMNINTNSSNQWGKFMRINHGIVNIYFWIFFFPVWEWFFRLIVISKIALICVVKYYLYHLILTF